MSEHSTHSAQRVWQWSDSRDGVSVLFVGSGAGDTAKGLLDSISPAPREVSWLRQVHSNGVCTASPGLAGEGDALISGEPGLGLAVATADCVPVLISAGGSVAAVHAGWRGLESGVIRAALAAVGAHAASAWIGPAIGPCCYEIGDDVAKRLREVAPAAAFTTGPTGRIHIDLTAIARHQLRIEAVKVVRSIDLCTRCGPERLESFRRDGSSSGRNWSMIWKT